jgi:hypothetical protein
VGQVGPGKEFVQVIDVDAARLDTSAAATTNATTTTSLIPSISIDREWLAIAHATRVYYNGTRQVNAGRGRVCVRVCACILYK